MKELDDYIKAKEALSDAFGGTLDLTLDIEDYRDKKWCINEDAVSVQWAENDKDVPEYEEEVQDISQANGYTIIELEDMTGGSNFYMVFSDANKTEWAEI